MTRTALSEEQILQMKAGSTTVIYTGCDDSVAQDKSLPSTAYLIKCKDGDKEWQDIVMGTRVSIFDSYWDVFKKNVIEKMDWTSGTINPSSWNSKPKPPKKRRRRKKQEEEESE